jgi:hypothetical protein
LFGGETTRKWAILGLILLIIIVVIITLAATDFAGIGTSMHNIAQDSIATPFCNLVVNSWTNIGSMGFLYVTIAGLTISIVGGLFWVLVVYGLFWKKGIQGKILHKAEAPATVREEPRDIIMAENPTPTKTKEEPKKEEVTVESTS